MSAKGPRWLGEVSGWREVSWGEGREEDAIFEMQGWMQKVLVKRDR